MSFFQIFIDCFQLNTFRYFRQVKNLKFIHNKVQCKTFYFTIIVTTFLLLQTFTGQINIHIPKPVLKHWISRTGSHIHIFDFLVKLLFGIKRNSRISKFSLNASASSYLNHFFCYKLKKSLTLIATIRRAYTSHLWSCGSSRVILRPQTNTCRIKSVNVYVKI